MVLPSGLSEGRHIHPAFQAFFVDRQEQLDDHLPVESGAGALPLTVLTVEGSEGFVQCGGCLGQCANELQGFGGNKSHPSGLQHVEKPRDVFGTLAGEILGSRDDRIDLHGDLEAEPDQPGDAHQAIFDTGRAGIESGSEGMGIFA